MGQGGGGGGGSLSLPTLDDVHNYISDFGDSVKQNPLQAITNLHIDAAKLALQPVDEGVGEVTGRNLAREQMQKAEARVADEESNRNRLISQQRTTAQAADVAASSAADTSRSAAAAARGVAINSLPTSHTQDFLGL